MALWLYLLFFADPFEASFREGVVALNRGDFPAAQTQLEAASRLHPRDARVWLALAQTYAQLHEQPLARKAAGTAEELGGDPGILHGLSLFYESAAGRVPVALWKPPTGRSSYPAFL